MTEKQDLFTKHLKTGWFAFDEYEVKIVLDDIVGGMPQSEELIDAWIASRCKDTSDKKRAEIRDAHASHLEEVSAEIVDRQTIGFARMPDGQLAIEGRQVKAMLKEAGNIIRGIAPGGDPKKKGVAALKSKVADRVFVAEDYIPLGRTEPDEVGERPIHVMTAQGPRNSLKRYEMLKNVDATFTIKRCRDTGFAGVAEKTLLAILDYAQQVGLGADRSQGRGLFKILSVTKTSE